MNAKTLRTLRKRKSWSQQRLAAEAGVSVRTVQRAERSGKCSDESTLRLSTALDVDLDELNEAPLTSATEAPPTTRLVRRLFGGGVSPRKATLLGGLLSLPAATFIAANVLKFELGAPTLYDILVEAGALFPGLSRAFIHPAVLMGLPVIAVVLGILAQVRVWGETNSAEHRVSIFGIDIVPHPGSIAIVGLAVLCLAILSGYVLVENLGHYVVDIVD